MPRTAAALCDKARPGETLGRAFVVFCDLQVLANPLRGPRMALEDALDFEVYLRTTCRSNGLCRAF